MKKRGNLVTISLIVVIVGLIVALMLPKIAKDRATGVIAFKTASARDIALTLNTICSYPYDTEIKYKSGLKDFIIEIKNNKVNVYDKFYVTIDNGRILGKDPTASSYQFNCLEKIDSVISNPDIIVMTKKGSVIEIKNEKANA